MPTDDPSIQFRAHGIALLRDTFSKDLLSRLKRAAQRLFLSVPAGAAPPDHYRFSAASNSVLLTALLDFGLEDPADLLAPLSAPGLSQLLSAAMGDVCAATGPSWTCNLDHSWLRKKFAPGHAPAGGYHLQNWHQDGALGVRFPPHPGPFIPMTRLLTCWIPLDSCGLDSPGLEFIRVRQPALLHFTELDDSLLRARFPPQQFCAPQLEIGDGLVFSNDVLHRTWVSPDMHHDRLSIEYRIFPRSA